MKYVKKIETLLAMLYRGLDRAVTAILRLLLDRRGKPLTGRWTHVPSAISLSRIVMGIMVVLSTGTHHEAAVLPIFLVGMFSDLVDGCAARILGPTKIGAIIDPMCDKAFFVLCAIGYYRSFNPIALWTNIGIDVFILAAPPIAVWITGIRLTEEDCKSNIFGKAKLTVQCLALLAAIAGIKQAPSMLLWAAAIAALASIIKKASDSKHAVRSLETVASR